MLENVTKNSFLETWLLCIHAYMQYAVTASKRAKKWATGAVLYYSTAPVSPTISNEPPCCKTYIIHFILMSIFQGYSDDMASYGPSCSLCIWILPHRHRMRAIAKMLPYICTVHPRPHIQTATLSTSHHESTHISSEHGKEKKVGICAADGIRGNIRLQKLEPFLSLLFLASSTAQFSRRQHSSNHDEHNYSEPFPNRRSYMNISRCCT